MEQTEKDHFIGELSLMLHQANKILSPTELAKEIYCEYKGDSVLISNALVTLVVTDK